MKKINLKAAMTAYAEHQKCTTRALYCAEHKDRWPEDYEDACKRQAEAREALQQAMEPINAAIKLAEGKATVRTIDADDLIQALVSIENRFSISKRAMEGVEVQCDLHAQNFPNAYRYEPMSTWFKAEFHAGHWNITNIYRDRTARETVGVRVKHTEASTSALIERMTTFSL